MKTLKTLLTVTLFASAAIIGTAQADNSLSSLIYEETSNIFSETTYQSSTATSIRSYGDDYNKKSVWSDEYEEYVNPSDFTQDAIASMQDVDQYMGSHPAAAGSSNGEVFIYNETAGEYHLQ